MWNCSRKFDVINTYFILALDKFNCVFFSNFTHSNRYSLCMFKGTSINDFRAKRNILDNPCPSSGIGQTIHPSPVQIHTELEVCAGRFFCVGVAKKCFLFYWRRKFVWEADLFRSAAGENHKKSCISVICVARRTPLY